MSDREYQKNYPKAVLLSDAAASNLAIVQVNYAYTGVMEIATGIIDLCGAAGTNPNYKTKTPIHVDAFPQYVGGTDVAPIVHGGAGSGNTSHQILAREVIKSRGSANDEGDFCGFTIRFDGGEDDKPSEAKFSGTSRSLNTGADPRFTNGELEVCLRTKIIAKLEGILKLYGWKRLVYAKPRVDPDSAQQKRGGAVAAAGLFAQIKGGGK